METRLD